MSGPSVERYSDLFFVSGSYQDCPALGKRRPMGIDEAYSC
jgi:hypothetical protein